MRSEREMFDLIVETAQADDRIRAVIMNGSRANPHAPRDIFQDFDIVYLVTDVAPYKNNLEWIKRFGKLMILQMPEDMDDPPGFGGDCFVYLMQFADGNRIDLGLYLIARLADLGRDSLSVLLLDKDGVVEPFDPPSERDYLPTTPTLKAFADCTNEFWWVCPYVAKGLWRQEILYAKHMLDVVVREQLMRMLRWHIGAKTNFACTPGKNGKYFRQYLAPELWDMLERTYAGANYDHTWEALFVMCELFRKVALPLAEQFGLEYPSDDDRRVSAHLQRVKNLPRDATAIY